MPALDTVCYLQAHTLTPLTLPLMSSPVRGGFPSPAQDYDTEVFDVMRYIAPHPIATFTLRVVGDSMRDAGIPDGCFITVDRSLEAQHGDIIVAMVDGEFTVKQLYQRDGRCELRPANPSYPTLTLGTHNELQCWGVVTAAIVPLHRPRWRDRSK